MKDYAGPCYSVAEALEILGMRKTELVHAVTEQDIRLVAYTQARSMLLFRVNKDKQWFGMANVLYRGHMTLHSDFILTLLEEQPIHMNRSWGMLLDDNGVQRWQSAYPFKRELPHGPLVDWIPKEQDTAPLNQYCATPLPFEFEPALDTFAKMLMSFKAGQPENSAATKTLTEIPTAGLQLDFAKHSEFKPSCVRVPASEIERYQKYKIQKSIELKAQKSIEAENALKTGERENQLHTLIGRIIQRYPEVGAKQAWALLRHDAEEDEKAFDTDEILLVVDQDALEWRSKYNEQRSLKYKSFAATLSKIKGKLKLKS